MRIVDWFRQLSMLRRAGVVANIALIAYSLVMAATWPWALAFAALGPGYSLWLIAKFQRKEARIREALERARPAGTPFNAGR